MDALARTRERNEDTYNSFPIRTGFPNWWTYHIDWYPGSLAGTNTIKRRVMSDSYPTGHLLGQFSENSCQHVIHETVGNTAMVIQWYGGYFQEAPAWSLLGSLPTGFPPIIDSGSRPDLLGEFLEQVNPEKECLMGLPFIKELRETVKMVKKPMAFLTQDFPRLATTYTRGKKFRKLSLAEVLTRTGFHKSSSLWLECHYGWDPLFMDLQSMAEGAASAHDDYERYKNGDPSWTKFKKYNAPVVTSSTDTHINSSVEYSNSEQHGVTGRYRYKPGGDMGFVISYPHFLAQRNGLSLSNLASAAWEVIPYSCVLDWAIPVGKLLQRLKGTPCNFDLDHVSHHTKFVASEKRSMQFANQGFSQLGVSQTQGWFELYTAKTKEYRRNYYNGEPEGLIGIGGTLSTSKMLTALSLIAQQLHLPLV